MAEMENSVTTEQQKEQPVVSQAMQRQNVRFVIITVGQGGFNVGNVLAKCLPNNPVIIATNTSKRDLEKTHLPEDFQFKFGNNSVEGAGKDRKRGKNYYDTYTENIQGQDLKSLPLFLAYYEEVLFHPSVQTIIVTCFSTDGGTGSGIGPKFTAQLSNYINQAKEFSYGGKQYIIDDRSNNVPRPVVDGLGIKCSVSEGQNNLLNTIECFKDIQAAVDARLANFFIADNNLPSSVKYTNVDDMYRIINARIAMPLLKFLGIESNSSIKCLDLQDKINTLRIPGCSAFTSLSAENKFQYVIPHGQSCKRIVKLLRFTEDGSEEAAAKQLLSNHDITSRDPMTAFFDLDDIDLGGVDSISKELVESSMIGFFGFDSLNAIVEDLRVNFHRLEESNEKKRNVIKTESTGFSTIAEDAESLSSTFGASTMTNDAIDNLF